MPHIKEKQQRAIYEVIASQVQTYAELQDHSTDKHKRVAVMTEAIVQTCELLLENVDIEGRTGNVCVCV